MKKRFKKVISFILTLSLIIGVLSVSFTAFSVSDEITLADIESFGASLNNLISESKLILDSQKDDDTVSVQSDKDECEPTRLIVKSSSDLDDMGAVSKVEGLLDLHIFQYENAGTATIAYQYYLNNKNVEWVEYDKIIAKSSVEPTIDEEWLTLSGATHLSWGADYMGIDSFTEELDKEALENVVVAVVDTGIDTDHPLFGGFYDETLNPDGRILQGADFSGSPATVPFEDDFGHGTHVSGTVVDLTLDNVKILPIKVLDSIGSGYVSSIATGILYAAYSGADVINMSFGGADVDSFVEGYAIDVAYNMGCTPVAAAGNDFTNAEFFSPGLLEKCITVGSLNEYLTISEFSNFGNIIDVCAPGEYILSANMGGGYITFDGTSMAAPHVSALAALYLSKNPALSVDDLCEIITSNAVDLGENGKDYIYGNGLAFAQCDSSENLGTIKTSLTETEYEEAVTVTLSCEGSDFIYYTLDGTNPLTSSSAVLYNNGIEIENTSKLRAVALSNSNHGISVPLMRNIFIENTDPTYNLFTDGTTIISATGILPSEYTVPSKYTSVGDYAFANHHEINTLSFAGSVTTVGEGAFLRCELESLDLNNVQEIGALSFACYSKFFELNALRLIRIGDCAFAYSEICDSVSFPKVKEIGKYAFAFTTLASLTLPEVRTIDDYAFFVATFSGDENSNELYAPKAETIGEFAFFYSFILNLDLPCVTKIGKYAFAYSSLTSIDLPILQHIDDYVFIGSWLEFFDIPNLKTIGDFSFAGCTFNTTNELPLVESIGNGAFYNIYAPYGLSLPKLVNAPESAFEAAVISSLSLPKLKTAGKYAFCDIYTFDENPSLTLSLPELVSADDYAFAGSYYSNFDLPKLKNIGNCAFMYCYNLSSISLPCIESIGSMAFLDTAILSVKLPDSVNYIATKAFNSDTVLIANSNSYTEQYAKENGYRFIPFGTMFTVTFVNARGRAISVQQVSAGDSATAPRAPFRLGQTFLSWDTDYSCIFEDTTISPIYQSIFENLAIRFLYFLLDLLGVLY